MIDPAQDERNMNAVQAFYIPPYRKGNRARLRVSTLRDMDDAVFAIIQRFTPAASRHDLTTAMREIARLPEIRAQAAGAAIADEIRRVLREHGVAIDARMA